MKYISSRSLKQYFARKFLKDTSGNVAIITALSVIPIISVLGFAVDFQLVVTKKNLVQSTLDATMIAAARERQAGLTDDELEDFTDNYFNALLKANAPTLTCDDRELTNEDNNTENIFDVTLEISDETEDLAGSINCDQKTTLTALFGRDKVSFFVESGSTFGVGMVDVAFVFDLSSSMNCPEDLQAGFIASVCARNNRRIRTRMDALKEAATLAVETLLETNDRPGSTIRIAMTGYTNAVNAGSFFENVVEIPRGNDRRLSRLENSEQLGQRDDEDWIGKVQIERPSNLQFFDYESIFCPRGTISNGTNCRGNYQDFAGRFYYPRGQHPRCVWARQGANAATDAPPTNGRFLRAARPVWNYSNNFNHNDDFNFNRKRRGQLEVQRQLGSYRYGRGGNRSEIERTNNSIPSNEVFRTEGAINANAARCNMNLAPQPLTSNETALSDFIDNMEPGGGTAGHVGLAWGWYLLSPNWSSIWPSASEPLRYDEPETAKVLILMTDGEFTDTAPRVKRSSTRQAGDICDSIKNNTNITIFTVKLGTFPADETIQGENITNYCASTNDLALNPTDGDELVEDFQQIAAQISDLRISN